MDKNDELFENDETKPANTVKLYDPSSGISPLQWLELKENVRYSQLPLISGERRFLNQLAANPVVALGAVGSALAIGGGLYAVRQQKYHMSNRLLFLRWGSSAAMFSFVLYKIWDQIDWEPAIIPILQKNIMVKFGFVKKEELPVLPVAKAPIIPPAPLVEVVTPP